MSEIEILYFACEGRSEEAYIKAINNVLANYALKFRCLPWYAEGGQISKINQCLKAKMKDKHIKPYNVYVVCDDDLRCRYPKKWDVKELLKKIDDSHILYNCHNFEDFLSLHFDEELSNQWFTIMTGKNHWSTPVCECTYLDEFKKVCPGYDKGRLPDGWDDTDEIVEKLKNLKERIKNRKLFYTETQLNHSFAVFLFDKVFTDDVWNELMRQYRQRRGEGAFD